MSPVRYDYTGESLCSWIQRHVWFGEMFTASEHVMNLDARLNLGKIKHVRTKRRLRSLLESQDKTNRI